MPPRVGPGTVAEAEEIALGSGLLAARRAGLARFRLTGPGRVACLQGLVTCDVQQTDGRLRLFGALLSNKGMIVAPLWIALRDDVIELETPTGAAAALVDVLRRTLPPRLCRWSDETAATASIGVYGEAAVPFAGALPAVVRGLSGWEAALPLAEAEAVLADAAVRGAVTASPALLERCRIEAGVPSLGAEIDARTLPQEVRFEELGAVSYTKGCYIGQETVARLHFRGHANRRLGSVDLSGEPPALPLDLVAGEKAVGHLTSAAWSPAVQGWIGLAIVRRDIPDDLPLEGGAAKLAVTVREQRWVRQA